MKFLEDLGFQPYISKNIWVRYKIVNGTKTPLFFATTKARGNSVVIIDEFGNLVISSDDKAEIIAKIRSVLISKFLD